ncbi:outer membrane protein assembly factor BamB family protein [Amycolatopsis jiangsuensis]|uniref:Sugar lactone lactonase YvrE n=1 Tax=Amycolatopsis jiangsuensis TaxID=1181879 RepID=A0A840INI9_9PSEU|nr:PQQ-binding-like beta-propeller repeat protein [Amycolatopsis jiangsuensis]MBB4683109.1 sugar lactone lactonase YvrE [Amycolatopsis jiangsuensis]
MSGATVRRLVPPQRMAGSNGIVFGPDGRLHVAEYLAGRVSAVDPATGDVEVVTGAGDPVQSPDDLAFGPDGSLYLTDLVPGRVWRRVPDGRWSMVTDRVAVPNGIAFAGDRLFVNEMRPGGRLLEVFPDGGEPVVVAGGLAMGNAMQLGPDGCLYYPHMLTGQVFRVPPDGGAPELVAGDVLSPVAVRFDRGGLLVVLSHGPAGMVTRIDLFGSGARSAAPCGIGGLDNAAFDDENRMFVSSYAAGGIAELHPDGRRRELVRPGFAGPFGVAVDSAGKVHAADHYRVTSPSEGRVSTTDFLIFSHGIAADGEVLHVTSQYGEVRTYHPADGRSRVRAQGLDRPVGVATREDGVLVVAEAGAGRIVAIDDTDAVTVLAEGFAAPVDVAFDGARCYVSDEAAGAVLRIEDGRGVPVLTGLAAPQGLAVRDGELIVLETGRRRLLAADPGTGDTRLVAGDLAVGSDREVPALFTHGLPGVPRRFAGVAVGPGGALYISAVGEGSVGLVEEEAAPPGAAGE